LPRNVVIPRNDVLIGSGSRAAGPVGDGELDRTVDPDAAAEQAQEPDDHGVTRVLARGLHQFQAHERPQKRIGGHDVTQVTEEGEQ